MHKRKNFEQLGTLVEITTDEGKNLPFLIVLL